MTIDALFRWVFGATYLNESEGTTVRIRETYEPRHDVRVRRWVIHSLLVLVTLLTPTSASRAQDATDEIERTVTAFLQPFANRNVQGFIDYFADGATVFMPSSAAGATPIRVEGKTSIAREFESLYQRLGVQPQTAGQPINPQNLLVQRYGDVAVVTFHLGTETARGRRTLVMVRTAAGWKITHLHASVFPTR